MSYNRLILTLTAVLLLAIPSFADDDEEKWRNFEVSLSTGLSIPSGDITDWYDSLGAESGFHIGLAGGYYFTEGFCAGIYFNYSRWGLPGDYGLNFQNYDVGSYLKYSLVNESNFEPYIKVSGGVVMPKYPTWETADFNILREQSYDAGYGFAGFLGITWFTSDFGSIFLELGYHNDLVDGVTANNFGIDYTLEGNTTYLELSTGVTVFFGPE